LEVLPDQSVPQRERTRLARVANFSVLCVSSAWLLPGVTVHTTAMRAPEPVRLDASTRVSLESRKGTCAAAPSLSLAMTEPSASSERLMKLPSLVCQRVTAAWRAARLESLLPRHFPHASLLRSYFHEGADMDFREAGGCTIQLVRDGPP
jgi:hypothetical protein